MSKIKVHAWDILRMIPDEEIAKIAKDTKVDYCAKVLTGERLFYLLVFAFLSADHVSQRRLESIFNNPTYKTLFNVALDATVTHGSISTRLANVNLDFFEKAFDLLYNRLSQLYTEKELQDKNQTDKADCKSCLPSGVPPDLKSGVKKGSTYLPGDLQSPT